MKKKRYNVLTYDPELETFTPQAGLTMPSQGVDIAGVRCVAKELRDMGYSGRLEYVWGEWQFPEPCVRLQQA
jgi:hypothetical protein